MAQPYTNVLTTGVAIFLVAWPFGCSGFSAGICTSPTEVPDYLAYTIEPIPGRSDQFAFCSNAIQLTFQCLQKFNFDPIKLECVSNSNFEAFEVQEPSFERLFPSFEYCDQFYFKLQNATSNPLKSTCPKGHNFDVLRRRCVPSRNLTYESQCSRVRTTATIKIPHEQSTRLTSIPNTFKNDSAIEEVEICSPIGDPCAPGSLNCVCDPETCTEVGAVPHPTECQLYYQCQENGFKYQMSCGVGEIFHPGLIPPACVWPDHNGHIECRDGPKPPTTSKPSTSRPEPTATVPDLSPEPTTRTTVTTQVPTTPPPITTKPSVPPPTTPASTSTSTASSTTKPSSTVSSPTTPPPDCRTSSKCIGSTTTDIGTSAASSAASSASTTSSAASTTSAPPTHETGGAKYNFILYFLILFLAAFLAMALILVILHKRKRRLRDQERIQFEAYHY